VRRVLAPDEQVQLDTYHVEAITGGTDAVVNVEVRLRRGNRMVNSFGVDEDIVRASVEAYLKGMNVFLMNGKRD